MRIVIGNKITGIVFDSLEDINVFLRELMAKKAEIEQGQGGFPVSFACMDDSVTEEEQQAFNQTLGEIGGQDDKPRLQ